MKKLLAVIASIAWFSYPAHADYLIRDGNNQIQTVKAFNCSGAICPLTVPSTPGGVAYSSGNPFYVAFPSAQPVTFSGTFPLPTGAATSANQLVPQTPVTPSPATATGGLLIGMQYNATQATFSDGQQGGVQGSSRGALFVTPGADLFPVQVNGASGQFSSIPTIQNAAYVLGNCVGGFQAVTVAAYNGQSGLITSFVAASASGVVQSLTIYLFDSNPSASTCTDRSTFTLNVADVGKLINNPTNSNITLLAPTGTADTFGSVDFTPPRPFVAGGSSASGVKTIYYAIVSNSPFTPGSTTDLHVRIASILN
jgi:hypothetical protein